MENTLRFGIIGCGFWANYQTAAWKELSGAEPVAVCDISEEKATALAKKFNIPAVYTDAEEMLKMEKLDFVDIISSIETHAQFVKLAANYGVGAIVQKPMGTTLDEATEMVEVCSKARVPFFVHENFRWQAPIRMLKSILDSGVIGKPFKARISFCSAFPVFDNQPALAELDRFIIMDIGTHVLDVARFLFGEVDFLTCQTQKVNPKIKGEDVANVLMQMKSGLNCFVEMSYASLLEKESFPETLILVEGDQGSVNVLHDCTAKITSKQGTTIQMAKPTMYPWIEPAYAVVQSSLVDCNKNILSGIKGANGETSGADNLKTLELVFGSYVSADNKNTITI